MLVFSNAALAQEKPTNTSSEIAHLLAVVAASPCSFIRNDTAYGGVAAAAHLQKKYAYDRDEIDSAEVFIDRAASRSWFTGRPYQVRCPGAEEIPARDWLRAELKADRAAAEILGSH